MVANCCHLHNLCVHLKSFDLTPVILCSGIRIQSFQKGQITMDIDFRWGGDPNIILSVETLVASLPIQVCKLTLKPGQKGVFASVSQPPFPL
jgi:hypothetical protein